MLQAIVLARGSPLPSGQFMLMTTDWIADSSYKSQYRHALFSLYKRATFQCQWVTPWQTDSVSARLIFGEMDDFTNLSFPMFKLSGSNQSVSHKFYCCKRF